MREKVSNSTKMADKNLAKIKSFLVDAVAPLSSVLECANRGKMLSEKGITDAVSAALELLGNASSKQAHLMREVTISHWSLSSTTTTVSPMQQSLLFGKEFAKRSKGQVKALRLVAHPSSSRQTSHQRTFFWRGPPANWGAIATAGAEVPTKEVNQRQQQGRGGRT